MSAVREREHHSGRMEPTFQIQKIAQNMIRRYSDKFDTNPIPNHQHRHGLRLGCAGRRPAAATARARDAGDPLPSPSAWPARSARLTAFPLPLRLRLRSLLPPPPSVLLSPSQGRREQLDRVTVTTIVTAMEVTMLYFISCLLNVLSVYLSIISHNMRNN